MPPTEDISGEYRTLVVIPTYNECSNIGQLLPQVLRHPRVEVLVVDDSSPDGTAQIVERLAGTMPGVHLIRRPQKLGLGTAYRAGFTFALEHAYDLIVEMDADFSHAPQDIPRFLGGIRDSDLVIGSRYIPGGETPGWPARRRLLSRAANLYTRALSGMPIRDATSGYRCFRRAVLQRIDLDRVKSNGYGFQIEMAFRAWKLGFRVSEIPIVFANRAQGQSKLDAGIVWEALGILWRLRALSLVNRL